jgi:hypothetical protein
LDILHLFASDWKWKFQTLVSPQSKVPLDPNPVNIGEIGMPSTEQYFEMLAKL